MKKRKLGYSPRKWVSRKLSSSNMIPDDVWVKIDVTVSPITGYNLIAVAYSNIKETA